MEEDRVSKKKIYKLEEIIPLLSEEQLSVAHGMIEDAMFMEKQLAKLRETIEVEGVSENYQYGSKQTAAMTSYLQIQKQYGVIIRYLTDLVPSNPIKKNNDELLEFLQNR